MPSKNLILCRPLLLLPSIFPSIRVFSNESTLRIRWPKYWSFSFSISPSKEHPGLISLRIDSLDLLTVQGTLKSLLQHHSSKASILQCSAFFIFQFSHPYMTTGKTIALARQTFVGKPWPGFFSTQNRSMASNLSQSECYYAYKKIIRTSFSSLTFISHSHICLFSSRLTGFLVASCTRCICYISMFIHFLVILSGHTVVQSYCTISLSYQYVWMFVWISM